MNDHVLVNGMVLKTSPVNDYDRRLVVLTKERGKITVFAKGARRQGSRTMAATNQFCFGTFKLYEGKNAYNLIEASITHYFEELRSDFEGAYLGMYFLEIADYYARENNDEIELLKLLFQSIRAIVKPTLDNRLVKSVFEIKALVVNGEFPGIRDDDKYQNGTLHTIEYIVSSSIERLYTFAVTDEILNELSDFSSKNVKKYIDRHFKSLELLKTISNY